MILKEDEAFVLAENAIVASIALTSGEGVFCCGVFQALKMSELNQQLQQELLSRNSCLITASVAGTRYFIDLLELYKAVRPNSAEISPQTIEKMYHMAADCWQTHLQEMIN